MARTTDITSFTDYRSRLRDHLSMVRESGRPLFVTTNGRTDAVVLSPEAYDALVEKAELADGLAQLARGKADLAAGRTEDARSALQAIADELGLNPPEPR